MPFYVVYCISFVTKAPSDGTNIHLKFFIQIRSGNGLIAESVDSRWRNVCFIFLFKTSMWNYIIKWVVVFIISFTGLT